ncbi:hypothetical protein SBA2_80052 [Acidobacteriia bacterium SbA2]|nr:hypothetical protein SBA2_80052 [Acidobacteriia bacterium SbA2]
MDWAGRLAQLVRASALQAEGRPFEPGTAHQKNWFIGSLSHRSIELQPGFGLTMNQWHNDSMNQFLGDVVQLVRTHACHA